MCLDGGVCIGFLIFNVLVDDLLADQYLLD